jgi:hypothetical protein
MVGLVGRVGHYPRTVTFWAYSLRRRWNMIELANAFVLPCLDAAQRRPLDRLSAAPIESFFGVIALGELRLRAGIKELVDKGSVLEAFVVSRPLHLIMWAGIHVGSTSWVERAVCVVRMAWIRIPMAVSVWAVIRT